MFKFEMNLYVFIEMDFKSLSGRIGNSESFHLTGAK